MLHRAEQLGLLRQPLEARELGVECFLEGSLVVAGQVLVVGFCEEGRECLDGRTAEIEAMNFYVSGWLQNDGCVGNHTRDQHQRLPSGGQGRGLFCWLGTGSDRHSKRSRARRDIGEGVLITENSADR